MSDFPEGWAQTAFGSITVNHDGKRIPLKASDRAARRGEYRYFGAQGVIDTIDGYLFDGSYLLIAEDGANLFSRSQPISQIATGRFWVNNHAHVVDAVDGISMKFLMHFMNANPLRGSVRGSAQPKLTQADLNRLCVNLPPSLEQDRIVSAIEEEFSRLDAGEAALARVRLNLNRLRSAAYASITESVEKWCPLGEIAEVVGGVTKDTKRQSDPSFVEVPYLRVANVQRGFLDLDTVSTIRVPAATVTKLRLAPNDILFNEGGDRDKLGRGWVWEGRIDDCIHQNHVFRARLRTADFIPKFVSMHGNAFGRTWFEQMGRQTTNLASLNLTTLKSFPVPDIPVERQRVIVAEIERQLTLIDSVLFAVKHSFDNSAAVRSSILAAAFSGRLVPQDPSDEPASALIQRIAAERAVSNGLRITRPRKDPESRERVEA